MGSPLGIVACALNLHNASRRQLRVQVRLACARELVGSEEAAVGNTRTLVLRVDNAAHPWLERPTNVIEQVGQRTIERGLWHIGTRGANVTQFTQVGGERVQSHS